MLEAKLVETLVLVFIASELLFQTKVESLYAKTILKKNQVHFLGSDVHRENGTYLIILDAIKKIRKIIGENKINEITTINPKKILQNEEWQY